jgi:hypothetical protein
MANFEAAISRRGGAIVRCAVYTRKSSEEGLEPQESPHLSDRSENVGEERLLLQHL